MKHEAPRQDAADGLAGLAPVGRVTVQERIYRQLRDGLIRGGFDAGAVFRIQDLADRMSVSTMPVREALGRLESEGALETMANRTVRVPPLSPGRAREIAEARALIEGELAARAVAHLTVADFDRLDALTAEYEAAPDTRTVADLNHSFHFLIYRRAAMPVLLPFVESLWMQAGPYVRAAARRHSPLTDASATLHHRGILAAARAGDPDRTAAELRADIGRAFAILDRAGPEVWQAQEETAP
jgi:DNA-binding GntR family transcriptional regulator